MIPLDDSDRAAYRADLLAQVVRERFGVTPWRELHEKPSPRPRPVVRVKDKSRLTARRRRDLNRAMLDPIDVRAERAA